ncbi:MAG: TIM barrel protein [Lachnospiraceae bacterium]|nr:TIM barrel protein [Lachnospiraceae bacterium]
MILECIPDYREAEDWAELAEKEKLVFEYNEFFNPTVLEDNEKIKEIISIYRSLNRDTSNDTVHGAFFDITVSSSDPLIRNASDYRVSQSIEIAEALNARGVVFHTNYLTDFKSVPYRDNWVDANILYWTEKCQNHPDINIYLENMFDESPELIGRVAEGMKELPNFGICLDIAHAFLSQVPVGEWIGTLEGFIKHIHINDNDGCEDLHLAVGSGKIDWSVLKCEKLFKLNPSVLIEVSTRERLDASIGFLKAMGFME